MTYLILTETFSTKKNYLLKSLINLKPSTFYIPPNNDFSKSIVLLCDVTVSEIKLTHTANRSI